MGYNTFKHLEERVFDAIHDECVEYLAETLNTYISKQHHSMHGELMTEVITELYRKRVALDSDLQK